MDEKMHFMTEPEELLNWMKEHEEFKVMNKEDAQILLNYMEGHDYRLGTDKDGSLVRVDINTDEYEAEQYSLDDVIDIVCEWNDELIRYTSQELNELSQGQDKSSLEVKVFPCFYCKDYTAFPFLLSPAIRCNPCSLSVVENLPLHNQVHNTFPSVSPSLPSQPCHYPDKTLCLISADVLLRMFQAEHQPPYQGQSCYSQNPCEYPYSSSGQWLPQIPPALYSLHLQY